jgi:glycosyltransferase involved in cell wall biosynthesis
MAVSESVRRSNAAALGIDPERIDVIHRGRDPRPFATLDGPAREGRRSALGLEPDDVLVLNVSRLLERKGQAELIDAHRQVVEAYPRARLWIAGEGPERGRLEARIAEAGLDGRARLLGTRDDVPELLQLADVFVLPSHYEGHSGALVEAMMAGLPIVATDTPTNRESVEPDRTARLAPIGDSARLAEAILWMLDRPDRGAALGAAARATAVERFDIREVAARHEALYDRVLAEASRAGGGGAYGAARGG